MKNDKEKFFNNDKKTTCVEPGQNLFNFETLVQDPKSKLRKVTDGDTARTLMGPSLKMCFLLNKELKLRRGSPLALGVLNPQCFKT